MKYIPLNNELFFEAVQNARLIITAESFFRLMCHDSALSWNIRDTHMFETLENILDAKGPNAKAIVWAHNSHIGNALATEMSYKNHEINIGQLCRERYGEDAVMIGFGTHTGTVAAASDWDGQIEIKKVRPSREDSYEYQMHLAGVPQFMIDLREPNIYQELRELLSKPRLERFIGVIYRPETERYSHYLKASLPNQFDTYVWFEETSAVNEISDIRRKGINDTYPFAL